MSPHHGHTSDPRGLKFCMDDPWVLGVVFHYSDFRISGFYFFWYFWIFALFSPLFGPKVKLWYEKPSEPYLRFTLSGFLFPQFGFFDIQIIFHLDFFIYPSNSQITNPMLLTFGYVMFSYLKFPLFGFSDFWISDNGFSHFLDFSGFCTDFSTYSHIIDPRLMNCGTLLDPRPNSKFHFWDFRRST